VVCYYHLVSLTTARLFHVNVNCSDLGRSLAFYRDALGLSEGARTSVDRPQPGAAFGLDEAQWDARILLGPRAYDGGAIDLLEWRAPRPIGAPPRAVNEQGFQRLGVRVPDFDATLARIRDLGGTARSEPFAHALDGGGEIRLALVDDPDGTAIELIEGGAPALSFVAVTCTDLARSLGFYESLGFVVTARYPSENDDGSHLGLAGRVAIDEIVLSPPKRGDVLFMLVGFAAPAVVAKPARPANALGMWRTAFIVCDLDAAYAELRELGIATIAPPVAMEMGDGLPELRFLCFRGPDGEVVELIEDPT
jgi:glyoxylase I family protein